MALPNKESDGRLLEDIAPVGDYILGRARPRYGTGTPKARTTSPVGPISASECGPIVKICQNAAIATAYSSTIL